MVAGDERLKNPTNEISSSGVVGESERVVVEKLVEED